MRLKETWWSTLNVLLHFNIKQRIGYVTSLQSFELHVIFMTVVRCRSINTSDFIDSSLRIPSRCFVASLPFKCKDDLGHHASYMCYLHIYSILNNITYYTTQYNAFFFVITKSNCDRKSQNVVWGSICNSRNFLSA